jgi:hypothetical protein
MVELVLTLFMDLRSDLIDGVFSPDDLVADAAESVARRLELGVFIGRMKPGVFIGMFALDGRLELEATVARGVFAGVANLLLLATGVER